MDEFIGWPSWKASIRQRRGAGRLSRPKPHCQNLNDREIGRVACRLNRFWPLIYYKNHLAVSTHVCAACSEQLGHMVQWLARQSFGYALVAAKVLNSEGETAQESLIYFLCLCHMWVTSLRCWVLLTKTNQSCVMLRVYRGDGWDRCCTISIDRNVFSFSSHCSAKNKSLAHKF